MTPIERSIEHWKENVAKAKAGTLVLSDISAAECALCQAHEDCEDCPLAEWTEEDDCEGTPWRAIHTALAGFNHSNLVANTEAMLRVLEECAKNMGAQNDPV